MAEINGTELTSELFDEVNRIIDNSSVSTILELASEHLELINNYKLKPVNAPIARKNLKKYLADISIMPDDLISFLGKNSLNRRFLCVFSLEAIEYLLPYLQIIFGKETVFLALILDSRKEVRELSKDLEQSDCDADTNKAIESFFETLTPFADIFIGLKNDLNTSADQQEYVKSTSEPSSNKALKKLEKKLEIQIANADKQQQKSIKLLDKVKKLESKLAELDLENQVMIKEKDGLDKRVINEVAKNTSIEISKYYNKWLQRPTEIENILYKHLNENTDINKRCKDVLEQQANRDKHFGNLRLLKEERRKLTENLNDINQAMRESLNPLPEINEIRDELINKIETINNVELKSSENLIPHNYKNSSDNNNFLADSIVATINSNSIEYAEDALQWLTAKQILPNGYLDKLRQLYNRKIGLNINREGNICKSNSAIFWLYEKAKKGEDVIVLLDGHNILHLLNDIFKSYYQNNIPGEKAREELIKRSIGVYSKLDNTQIRLYFDSNQRSEQYPSENVTVVYSGGENNQKNRADISILNYLEFLNNENKSGYTLVVSDDRDIKNKSISLGAQVASPAFFACLLVDDR